MTYAQVLERVGQCRLLNKPCFLSVEEQSALLDGISAIQAHHDYIQRERDKDQECIRRAAMSVRELLKE